MAEDPRVSLVDNFGHQGQIISAETAGVLPAFVVLVEPTDRHVVTCSVLRLVLPDRGFDAPESNLMHRTLFLGCF